MRREKQKAVAGIGLIRFVADSKNKRIRLSIKPFRGIRVSYPPRTSERLVIDFIEQHKTAILKALDKIAGYEQDKSLEEQVDIDKKAAAASLYRHLDELAKQYGFSYNNVTFRNQKTRWGSCSGKNNLSLNIQIYLLPDELRDYILLHELLHTKIKNHSAYYWSEFSKILPKARELNLLMRKYPIRKIKLVNN